MQSSCNQLLQKIYEISFALDDVTLYLDTHPCDQDALAYFQYVSNLRKEAMEVYETSCGPLMIDHVVPGNYWNWVNDPWPWEGGTC